MEKRGGHLSDEEKCCLLLKSMKGNKAYKIVKLNSGGNDGYDRYMKALLKEFGRSRVIYPCYIRKIMQNDSYDYNRESLERIREQIGLSYQVIKDLEADTLSQFLAAIVIERFSPKLLEKWNEHTTDIHKPPTFEELENYILPTAMNMSAESSKSLPVTHENTIKKPSTTKAQTSAKPSGKKCSLCKETYGLSRCPIFLAYDVDKRNKYVRDQRWCTNCLHPSHTCSQCSSSFTCRTCKGKHHWLLHKDDPQASASNNLMVTSSSKLDQTTEKPPTIASIPTAVVNAINGCRDRKVRIALDTGATISTITESLASHLKLKRFPQRTTISGTGGDEVSKSFVKVHLQSTHDPDQIREFTLSVLSKLPPIQPPVGKQELAEDPNVKDLQLADPDFGGSLDVLLSVLDTGKCLTREIKYHDIPNLLLFPTIFGWAVAGPVIVTLKTPVLRMQTKEDTLEQDLQCLWELDKPPEAPQLTPTDEAAVNHFHDTYQREEDGRYKVCLPRPEQTPTLGESRNMAVKRFTQNERSLIKRNKLSEFNAALAEYITLHHAEQVPTSELTLKPAYYLPIHGVFKDTSTTTKV